MAILKPYRYSYSGADAKVFAMLSDYPETTHLLESIHTLSVSVHEAKGQARSLGYRGAKGLSRGVRTIAGSIIMTIVEDHPLRQLMLYTKDKLPNYRGGWSIDRDMIGVGTALKTFDFSNRLAELLPPIDLLVTYVSEGGQFAAGSPVFEPNKIDLVSYEGAAMLIQGIDFVDSGVVTSVNDIVSEITLSFIAMDFKPITLGQHVVGGGDGFNTYSSQDLRKNHSRLEKLLYGDWTPPVTDQDLVDPDKEQELVGKDTADVLPRFSGSGMRTPFF
jgi:hypothetical protein